MRASRCWPSQPRTVAFHVPQPTQAMAKKASHRAVTAPMAIAARFHDAYLPGAALGLSPLDAQGFFRDSWNTGVEPRPAMRCSGRGSSVNGVVNPFTRREWHATGHPLQRWGMHPTFLFICASNSGHFRLRMRAGGEPAHAARGLRAGFAGAQCGRDASSRQRRGPQPVGRPGLCVPRGHGYRERGVRRRGHMGAHASGREPHARGRAPSMKSL